MTDAAKKKIAGTVGASNAKPLKGPKAVSTDISDPSLDYISEMLAAAKPGSAPTVMSRLSLRAFTRLKSSAAA